MKIFLKYCLTFIICLICSFSFTQNRKIDSLKLLLKSDKEDTNKVEHLINVAAAIGYKNLDTAIYFTKEALSISQKINWGIGKGKTLHQIGLFLQLKSEYRLALDYYYKAAAEWEIVRALAQANQIDFIKDKQSLTYGNIGIIHQEQGNYPKALESYFKTIKLEEELGRKEYVADFLGNIGNVYYGQQDYSKALEYYFKALKLENELGNKKNIARHYSNIGSVYSQQKNNPKSLKYYLKALPVQEQFPDKAIVATTLGNIGDYYYNVGKQDSALVYYLKALKIALEVGDKRVTAVSSGQIGALYIDLKKYADAEKYLARAALLCDSIGILKEKIEIEKNFYKLYSQTGDFKNALLHYKKYTAAKDSIFNEDKNKELTRYELNYEFDKKQAAAKAEQDKKDAVTKAEGRKQQIVLALVSCVLILVFVFLAFIFRSLRITRKQKIFIEAKNRETEQQKALIEEKNKDILDSIRYAKRIQHSLLPTEKYIDRNINQLKKKS